MSNAQDMFSGCCKMKIINIRILVSVENSVLMVVEY